MRRCIGNSWKIFFIDSLLQGSDRRFNDWKSLFLDQDLFSGKWVKVKVLQQSELEYRAWVCLHGVCFALSKKKIGDIITDLSRFKDLSLHSRLMVSNICNDRFWSLQKWPCRIIGDENLRWLSNSHYRSTVMITLADSFETWALFYLIGLQASKSYLLLDFLDFGKSPIKTIKGRAAKQSSAKKNNIFLYSTCTKHRVAYVCLHPIGLIELATAR